MNKNYSIVIYFVVINVFLVKSQELNGEWIELQDNDFNAFPITNIIDIFNDSIVYYNFNETIFEKKVDEFLKFDPHRILIDKNEIEYYNLLNSNRLTFKIPVNNSIIERHYVRLEPTKIFVSPEEVEKTIYRIEDDLMVSRIIFDKKLPDMEVFKYGDNILGNKLILEKRGKTFFVSVYIEDDRINIIPIKEMSTEYLILYGLDYKDEIKALKE